MTEAKHAGADLTTGFEAIKQANATIMTTDIKGKSYAQVNERVKAFRMVHPLGTIETEIVSMADGIVTMRTRICTEDGQLLGTGFAQEKESASYINKTSHIGGYLSKNQITIFVNSKSFFFCQMSSCVAGMAQANKIVYVRINAWVVNVLRREFGNVVNFVRLCYDPCLQAILA